MNHARAATTLYRVATCIEVLAQWCPPVKKLLSSYVIEIPRQVRRRISA